MRSPDSGITFLAELPHALPCSTTILTVPSFGDVAEQISLIRTQAHDILGSSVAPDAQAFTTDLQHIVPFVTTNLIQMVNHLIRDYASRNGGLADLARAATDVALFKLAQTYEIEPQTPPLPELERIIRSELGFFDPLP